VTSLADTLIKHLVTRNQVNVQGMDPNDRSQTLLSTVMKLQVSFGIPDHLRAQIVSAFITLVVDQK
jgi:hypothetical protein